MPGDLRRDVVLQGVAVAGLALAAMVFFGGGYPNFDAAYAIVWGSELFDGALPDYEAGPAPTPHPLATGLGAIASLLGHQAYDALTMVSYLSFGVVVVAVFDLGRTCFSWRVGLLAAFVMASSYTVLSRTTASYFDLPAVALMVVAAALEARRPRRGALVLVLLAVAGLQRPEAWLLAGVYWLYLLPALPPPRRIALAALAAAGPLLWLLADLVVTGNPLFSFVETTEVSEEVAEVAEAEAVEPRSSEEQVGVGLRAILRLPVLAGAAAGVLIAGLAFREGARVPMAAAVLGVGGAFAMGFAGILLVDRFLFLPAAMLAAFFALAALGWIEGRPVLIRAAGERRWVGPAWLTGGVALLLAFGASLPTQAERMRDLRDGAEVRIDAVDDLYALAELTRAGAALRSCARVYLPNEQLIPLLAYATDRSPADLIDARDDTPGRGAFVAPTRRVRAVDAFFLHSKGAPDPGSRFAPVEGNRSWRVYANGCGPSA